MTITPLDETRIVELAYRLWLEEGRPDGRADDHWHRARDAIAAEVRAEAPALPSPAAAPKRRRARAG